MAPVTLRVYFVGAHSTGKAQPLDRQILTPHGFVPLGSLQTGGQVVGADGKPTVVVGVYERGFLPVFRVTFSDGSSTECCDEHLWARQDRLGKAFSVQPLREIRKRLTNQAGQFIHRIPQVAPVQFEGGPTLPIHPYLLGALLGDGSSGVTEQVALHNTEEDVLRRCEALLPEGDMLRRSELHGEGTLSYRIKRKTRDRKTRQPSETKKHLRSLGLLGLDCFSKYIPSIYLHASVEDRLALLRGLVDTDGTVAGNGWAVDLGTASERLAQDIVFLVRSLGGIVTKTIKPTTFAYKGQKKAGAPSHRLYFWFQDQTIPVASKKNLKRWGQALRKRLWGRTIREVVSVGSKNCRCIQVAAPDGLYITDDFIVTHNTTLTRHFAKHLGLPMISEVARSVLAEMELPFSVLRTDLEQVSLYQSRVFERQVEVEKTQKAGFVSDRAFDNLAYTAEHAEVLHRIMGTSTFRDYMKWVSGGHVFFIRPHKNLLAEDGVRESPEWDSIVRIDGMVKLLLEQFEVPYLPISTASMQERVKTVKYVIDKCRAASSPVPKLDPNKEYSTK